MNKFNKRRIKKYNWKKMIHLNLLMMNMVGLYPEGDKKYQFNLYTLWAMLCILVFNFGPNLFQTINILLSLDDLQVVVASGFITLPEILCLLKIFYVVHNMGTLKNLMAALDNDRFQPKDIKQLKASEPSFKFWNINFKFYWIGSLGSIFFWATYPLLNRSVNKYQLPFGAWYPFNTDISPLYELTYIYQIVAVFCLAIAAISIDTLICALHVYIGAQFDILCDNVRHLFENDEDLYTTKKFVYCVEHYNDIVRFAEETNKFCNWIMLLQFFVSAVSIGITMFLLTMVVPLSGEFFSLLSFLSSITAEIFIFCWFGNEVEIKSRNVPYAAYESDWINASDELKKDIIFFIARSQNPTKMSALNLFYLSLETFVKILRTAWSYFALLHQMSDRK